MAFLHNHVIHHTALLAGSQQLLSLAFQRPIARPFIVAAASAAAPAPAHLHNSGARCAVPCIRLRNHRCRSQHVCVRACVLDCMPGPIHTECRNRCRARCERAIAPARLDQLIFICSLRFVVVYLCTCVCTCACTHTRTLTSTATPASTTRRG